MADNKSKKALVWISGALVVLLIGGFAYKKYLEMRMAGASGGDAFLFMMMVFIGVLAVVGIAAGFIYFYMIPEGYQIHKGLKSLRNKKPQPKSKETLSIEETNREEEIKHQETELNSLREDLLSLLSSYSEATFRKVLTPTQISELISNIRKFADGDENISHIETVRSEFVTPVDLYHYGWNISIRLIADDKNRKLRIATATFLKDTFQITLADHAITTIANKLTTTDGKYSLRLIKPQDELAAHVFPGTENLPIKSDQ